MNVIFACYRKWAVEIFEKVPIPGPGFKMLAMNPEELDRWIEKFPPKVILAYGWSWIISERIIEKIPCWCLHPSPLPKYRGGSPLQHQIINGERMSAVSIFRMTKELDAGPLLTQVPFLLSGSLDMIFDQIVSIAVGWTIIALRDLARGFVPAEWPQEGEPTYFSRRKPEQSRIETIELVDTAERLHNKVRALSYEGYPPAYLLFEDGSRLEILKTKLTEPKKKEG